jgi:ABC-type dipeptide/oligopeptide/nickel transport system permease subunit
MPVWVALVATFALSITFKRRLGLYGKLFDSPVGMIGFGIVMFWVFTAIFADFIITMDPLAQFSGSKNAVPGSPLKTPVEGAYPHLLFGADHVARDVFSRMVMGSREVLKIAPAATLFAFMVGITLGLPAGYIGGKLDTVLSFLANLVLAFPVILLFYLLGSTRTFSWLWYTFRQFGIFLTTSTVCLLAETFGVTTVNTLFVFFAPFLEHDGFKLHILRKLLVKLAHDHTSFCIGLIFFGTTCSSTVCI